MKYIVLAGGFWRICKDIYDNRIVDKDLDGHDHYTDYVFAIDGMPDDFFKPLSYKRHTTYHCKRHDRDIPEYEIERRIGCSICTDKEDTNNEPIVESRDIMKEVWNTDAFEKYRQEGVEWLDNDYTYRIWCNNEQGREKLRELYRYMQTHYPVSKVLPLPRITGNRIAWKLNRKEVPLVDLNIVKVVEEPKEEVKDKESATSNVQYFNRKSKK